METVREEIIEVNEEIMIKIIEIIIIEITITDEEIMIINIGRGEYWKDWVKKEERNNRKPKKEKWENKNEEKRKK